MLSLGNICEPADSEDTIHAGPAEPELFSCIFIIACSGISTRFSTLVFWVFFHIHINNWLHDNDQLVLHGYDYRLPAVAAIRLKLRLAFERCVFEYNLRAIWAMSDGISHMFYVWFLYPSNSLIIFTK